MQGVVLAGGQSSRMGRPKELLEVGGQTIIESTTRLLLEVAGTCMVISNHKDRLPRLPDSIPVYQDDTPGLGPLGGLLTAMRRTSEGLLLVVACDMPALHASVLHLLVREAQSADSDVILPVWNGKAHPLCAVYCNGMDPLVLRLLGQEKRKMFDLLSQVRVKQLDVSAQFDKDVFFNMNTPADYEMFRKEETRR
ncbi:molybdenum cofactor guanylyltransferase [Aneurinibacillus sp. Ricciae_BoGa-3]|uniref:molybdenum cofactor guanylyltransferase n=1 Tax=Aneurinibacillus sp. Ricciae_BoGa-3 TaxID=3022697 RepID=UPI0023426B0D|nr:molybdenum cofactor guanylyltransferase [Aneurinibacillus sp. Ricciae_BoGa-3]WCK52434.1 molybdenum cofactor guanylyltransferase [Aneurinibacillus sp. Ricciae_BoGa-3]